MYNKKDNLNHWYSSFNFMAESMRKMDELTQISKINSVLIDNGIETIS